MKRPLEGAELALALEQIAVLEALIADLRRLAAGQAPTAADLKDAPILDRWNHEYRNEPCLIGYVQGHPVLGSGRVIKTSTIWAGDGSQGWVRTLSRFYRLGYRRADQGA